MPEVGRHMILNQGSWVYKIEWEQGWAGDRVEAGAEADARFGQKGSGSLPEAKMNCDDCQEMAQLVASNVVERVVVQEEMVGTAEVRRPYEGAARAGRV